MTQLHITTKGHSNIMKHA